MSATTDAHLTPPAPWRVQRYTDPYWIVGDAEDHPVAILNSEALAHQIAALPALLDAARAGLETLWGAATNANEYGALKAMAAALDLAEGRTP